MYVRQLELTRFKSFNQATTIPLLPGLTVVSGPNGSGKSNILDAILFALGLSSSRGLRAEKLSDLVHAASLKKSTRKTETRVSVTFALSDAQDWKVTRRLRVNPENDSYTSTYYINDVPCTLAELHNQLAEMCIYPDGYNVVLQGDVTGIISMNPRERRQIIDELAGVANFDRKIEQARDKLEAVREQEERSQLVRQELHDQAERLTRESQKATQYQRLRTEVEQLQGWQKVLARRHVQQQITQAALAIATASETEAAKGAELYSLQVDLEAATTKLETLQQQVRQLGEADYVQQQGQLAQLHAQQQQGQQQQQATRKDRQQAEQTLVAIAKTLADLEHQRTTAAQRLRSLEADQATQTAMSQAQAEVDTARQAVQAVANANADWQTQQRHLSQAKRTSQAKLNTLLQTQVRLQTRREQLQQQLSQLEAETPAAQNLSDQAEALATAETAAQTTAAHISRLQEALNLDRATLQRLQQESQTLQRHIDRYETRQQVLFEGSRAAQVIIKAQLPGVHGLVANLANVEPRYQQALEIAAGGRLQYLVVDDDEVASGAIAILKRQNAGRATFLPLTKLQPARSLAPLNWAGAVDYALRLIDFEPQYAAVFAFVLGQTVVVDTLENARRQLGRFRMVTLDGELLEPSGAMTGGSLRDRGGLKFQASEPPELIQARQRASEIETLLLALAPRIEQHDQDLQQYQRHFSEQQQQARQLAIAQQQYLSQQQNAAERQQQRQQQQSQLQAELQTLSQQATDLSQELAPRQAEDQQLAQQLAALEASSLPDEWRHLQTHLDAQEAALKTAQTQHQAHLKTLQDLRQSLNQAQLSQEQQHLRQHEWQQRLQQAQQNQTTFQAQQERLSLAIATVQQSLSALDGQLSELRHLRDQQDLAVRNLQQQAQRLEWERHTAVMQQQEKQELIEHLQQQLSELPAPPAELAPVPANLSLDDVQRQIRRTEDKLRALEPVNMLALEEFNATQGRLVDLETKLKTLAQERTELLLRIENFTTLRTQAFMTAFDAVNTQFQAIFAQLSDGDGYLQLENTDDPLSGGLMLVAHPKGKPVRRLSSMSGGEKSLTALSFIFALQRYRPSSFYALDEVDMFLDGANVEKLAIMLRQQAEQAQFIVISLRRPMLDRAARMLGVTQARGAQTQVIGIANPALAAGAH